MRVESEGQDRGMDTPEQNSLRDLNQLNEVQRQEVRMKLTLLT
jgi:hypothetical protein